MATEGWQRPFDDPIPLPDGGQLETLADAIAWLTRNVPKAEHETGMVQTADRTLTDAAEHGGIVMLARIAMMRVVNRGRPPPAPAPRRKAAKAYRVVR
jgi:hypothetical protein